MLCVDDSTRLKMIRLKGRRRTTGHLVFMRSPPVGWKSKLQLSVSLLTLELEWAAMVARITHGILSSRHWLSLDFRKQGCLGFVTTVEPSSQL